MLYLYSLILSYPLYVFQPAQSPIKTAIMSRINYGYKRRQHDILMTSMCVIDKMENNPLFPKPPAALEKLKKATPAFQKALANALGRDKHMVAVKDGKKELVLALLQALVKYVLKV